MYINEDSCLVKSMAKTVGVLDLLSPSLRKKVEKSVKETKQAQKEERQRMDKWRKDRKQFQETFLKQFPVGSRITFEYWADFNRDASPYTLTGTVKRHQETENCIIVRVDKYDGYHDYSNKLLKLHNETTVSLLPV